MIKDGLDWHCRYFLRILRREYRGQKAEISPFQISKLSKRFCMAHNIRQSDLLHAMIRRGIFEPSAADTYMIRYDMVER